MKIVLRLFFVMLVLSEFSCKRCVQTDAAVEREGTLSDSAGGTFAAYTLKQYQIQYNPDCQQDTACNNFIYFKNLTARTVTFTYKVENKTTGEQWAYSNTINKLKGNDTTTTTPQWVSNNCGDINSGNIVVSVVSAVKYE